MANTREIRRRIKSVKNTAQITKAMQMVAASKMRRAQQAALAGREYARLLNEVLVSLRERVEEGAHPLLVERPIKRELVLVLATDKGLCGALNTNLLREASQFKTDTVRYVASGRKAVQYLARTKRDLLADFELKDAPGFAETKRIAKFCVEKFLDGEVDKVTVVYTHFVNTLTQKATVRTLLPISAVELHGGKTPVADEAQKVNSSGFIFEPNAEQVLDAVLPQFVNFQIYQMVLDARASEHSARMVAMKSATDNAKQLVKDLTLEYNKVRQAAITTELLEITTAQMAVGG
ncbi:MAG: ATP synthase F1 subunit gamma [Verrucomicrobia bacterium]|nr:ATP synthase F1 subunit gamma [Verrucomicrobiota bacterium]